jgi:hypothetical protein
MPLYAFPFSGPPFGIWYRGDRQDAERFGYAIAVGEINSAPFDIAIGGIKASIDGFKDEGKVYLFIEDSPPNVPAIVAPSPGSFLNSRRVNLQAGPFVDRNVAACSPNPAWTDALGSSIFRISKTSEADCRNGVNIVFEVTFTPGQTQTGLIDLSGLTGPIPPGTFNSGSTVYWCVDYFDAYGIESGFNSASFRALYAALIGVFRVVNGQGRWYLDTTGNGVWNPGVDTVYTNFGTTGDIPVVGDWNGDGHPKIGVFRVVNGVGRWYLDTNGNGVWNAGVDAVYTNFGQPGDIPVTGDWNGDGKTEIGVFRIVNGQGRWYLDTNGYGVLDPGVDTVYTNFGTTGDIPVVGDWNGDGHPKIGVFRVVNGVGRWYLDTNGNGVWNAGVDTVYTNFGQTGDIPVTGDWNADGRTKIGIFRIVNGQGRFYLDFNGNGVWEGASDKMFQFGSPGDRPVAGRW